MSNNQILIFLNGEEKRVLSNKSNKIIIAKTRLNTIKDDHMLLQCNFEILDDLIKAESIIKSQLSKIDEFIIINKDIDLNMISYQYDYNHIKLNYEVLTNIIYFINLLIPLFNYNFRIVLSLEKDNHFKVHINNFNNSLINYLQKLKIDLKNSNNIQIKKLD